MYVMVSYLESQNVEENWQRTNVGANSIMLILMLQIYLRAKSCNGVTTAAQ